MGTNLMDKMKEIKTPRVVSKKKVLAKPFGNIKNAGPIIANPDSPIGKGRGNRILPYR